MKKGLGKVYRWSIFSLSNAEEVLFWSVKAEIYLKSFSSCVQAEFFMPNYNPWSFSLIKIFLFLLEKITASLHYPQWWLPLLPIQQQVTLHYQKSERENAKCGQGLLSFSNFKPGSFQIVKGINRAPAISFLEKYLNLVWKTSRQFASN